MLQKNPKEKIFCPTRKNKKKKIKKNKEDYKINTKPPTKNKLYRYKR